MANQGPHLRWGPVLITLAFSYWRVIEHTIPKYDCTSLGPTTPTNVTLIILICRHLKNNKRREGLSLVSIYLRKDRSSKRNVIVINSSTGSFINQKTDSYHRRREQNSWHQTQTNCHGPSYLPSILLRAWSSFLKIIYSHWRGLSTLPVSLWRWYLSLNFKATSLGYSVFLGISCVYLRSTW